MLAIGLHGSSPEGIAMANNEPSEHPTRQRSAITVNKEKN